MRFMIMVKANATSESGAMPDESLIAAMATYHEELAKAGVLLDASGLQPSLKGWRVRYSGGRRAVVDGPFAETKELIAGYTRCSMRFSGVALSTSRCTKMPGVWIASGSSSPFSTISSTSATVIRPAIAHIGLKLRAVRR